MKVLMAGRKFGGVAGGLERSVITLLNELDSRGHEANLLTWDNSEAKTHYSMNANVNWRKLNLGDPLKKSSWKTRWLRQMRIRQSIKEINPEAIVAFQHGTFLAIRTATIGLGIPILAAERNAPHRFDHLRVRRKRNLIFFSCLFAKKVTIQFEEYCSRYPWYLRERLVHIPNPVKKATSFAQPGNSQKVPKVLLFVGHLSYQKNPGVLLRAFRNVCDSFPDWRLHLIGSGEYRNQLQEDIIAFGLGDRVVVHAIRHDIEKSYVDADLFCLPSLWEGFPNALAEALAHGLPAVGFRGCAGVNLLIKHEENGLLADGNGNVVSLTYALEKLMGSPELRKDLGSKAITSVSQFDSNSVFDKWEALLLAVMQKSK